MIPLADILDAARKAGERGLHAVRAEPGPAAAGVLRRLDVAMATTLAGATLADLAQNPKPDIE